MSVKLQLPVLSWGCCCWWGWHNTLTGGLRCVLQKRIEQEGDCCCFSFTHGATEHLLTISIKGSTLGSSRSLQPRPCSTKSTKCTLQYRQFGWKFICTTPLCLYLFSVAAHPLCSPPVLPSCLCSQVVCVP